MLPLGNSLWRPAFIATHSLLRLTTTCDVSIMVKSY